jgi:DNA-binding NarL/FixJ family response regulator
MTIPRSEKPFGASSNGTIFVSAAKQPMAKRPFRKRGSYIVLLDINMPGMNGIQAAAEILRVSHQAKIVFLSVHNTPGTLHATKVWADAFVPKSAIGTALIPVLIHVSKTSRIAAKIEASL